MINAHSQLKGQANSYKKVKADLILCKLLQKGEIIAIIYLQIIS